MQQTHYFLIQLQKLVTWRHIKFESNPDPGLPAVRYVDAAGSGQRKVLRIPLESVSKARGDNTLKKGELEVDLTNSDSFDLGIETSMAFVPFMGAQGIDVEDFCKEAKEITIYVEEKRVNYDGNTVEWMFSVKSDRYDESPYWKPDISGGNRDFVLKLKGTGWPIRQPQLEEIEFSQLDEYY